LYDAAIAGALPESATRTAVAALEIPDGSRMHIIAIGKAALAMCDGALAALGGAAARLAASVAVAPADRPLGADIERAATDPRRRVRIVVGDHPIPGPQSLAAAQAIGDVVAGVQTGDHVLVLISGGGSSLAAAPAPEVAGFSQGDLGQLYEALLASGADIHLVNAVRKRFARWTGGRLALALSHAHVHCLAVSDVPGDDPGAISSGPCVGDSMTAPTLVATLHASRVWQRLPRPAQMHLDAAANGLVPETPKPNAPALRQAATRVIVSNRQALETAAARARAAGIEEVTIEPALLTGEAAIAGVRMASDLIARRKRARGPRVPRCILWGGETTVTIPDQAGSDGAGPVRGGRCQELRSPRPDHSPRPTTMRWASRCSPRAPTDAMGQPTRPAGSSMLRPGSPSPPPAAIPRATWRATTPTERSMRWAR
jgi:hydroxypyruvate reductase